MKTAKPCTSAPIPARPRKHVVSMGKLKPLTEEAHRRMREAARDPQLTAARRFPAIKD